MAAERETHIDGAIELKKVDQVGLVRRLHGQ